MVKKLKKSSKSEKSLQTEIKLKLIALVQELMDGYYSTDFLDPVDTESKLIF
jgi:hypothetical protein